MPNPDRRKLVELALGRIFLLMSRPFQEGDIEEYHRCRAIILEGVDTTAIPDYRPNYARHHRAGAQGD